MKFYILASGSKGNSLLIITEKTKIIIDCGISFKNIETKLQELNCSICDIDAVLITHGHNDHIKSLAKLSKHIKIYISKILFSNIKDKINLFESNINLFSNEDQFNIKDCFIRVVPVMHDCIDPVGFIIDDDIDRIGVFTDIGKITDKVISSLSQCSIILLESNHDINLLVNAERPWFLKNRILTPKGHLSNRDAGRLLSKVHGSTVKEVVLMHLSEECNTPHLAKKTVLEELKNNKINISNLKIALSNGELFE